MNLLVLLGVLTYLVAFLLLKVGWAHPTTVMLVGWAVVLVAQSLLPLGIMPASDHTYVLIGLGLVGWSLPTFWTPQPPLRPPDRSTSLGSIRLVPFAVTTAVIAMAVVVGALAFRARITASLNASSFASLDATEIRLAMTGEARDGGPISLLTAFAPLLAALGVIGARRFSRWWFGATALALAVTAQSPARTTTLTAVVVAAVVWTYLQNTSEGLPSSRRPMLFLAAAAGASLAYFQIVNNVLGKTEMTQRLYPDATLPAAVLSPASYFTGGISALTSAVASGFDPTAGNAGRSIYVIPRALSPFIPEVQTPDTLADFVRIPRPFNVYTAFGDMYFDFGMVGVFLMSLLAGWLIARAHRQARSGDMAAIWLSASLLAVMASTAQAFRLFHLDIVAPAIGGFVVLRLIGRPDLSAVSPGEEAPTRQRVPAGAWTPRPAGRSPRPHRHLHRP